MGIRIVSDLFASYTDEEGVALTAQRGDIVELSTKDEERLEKAGALEPQESKSSKPASSGKAAG